MIRDTGSQGVMTRKKELFCLQTFLSFERATGRRPCLV